MSKTPNWLRRGKEQEYPGIEERAQQAGAEIAWGDEAGVRSDAQVGRGYAPVGETPEIRLNTQRARVNYIKASPIKELCASCSTPRS